MKRLEGRERREEENNGTNFLIYNFLINKLKWDKLLDSCRTLSCWNPCDTVEPSDCVYESQLDGTHSLKGLRSHQGLSSRVELESGLEPGAAHEKCVRDTEEGHKEDTVSLTKSGGLSM